MGIFDFLRKSSGPPGAPPAGPEKKLDRKIAGPAKVVADKRAQSYDRYEAIQTLANARTPEAASALLKRFTFTIDPSITDQEEKDLAFQGVVDTGRIPKGLREKKGDDPEREQKLKEAKRRRKEVISAVSTFCEKAEQLTWPLKILRALLKDDEYGKALIALLEKHDVEYAKNVDPKVQIVVAMEDVVSEDVREAVERFLDDVNETVRFHAVQTTFAQGSDESVPALAKCLVAEESVRIKNKIAEGLLVRGFTIPEELRQDVASHLRDTDGYALGKDGKIVKSARRDFFDD